MAWGGGGGGGGGGMKRHRIFKDQKNFPSTPRRRAVLTVQNSGL